MIAARKTTRLVCRARAYSAAARSTSLALTESSTATRTGLFELVVFMPDLCAREAPGFQGAPGRPIKAQIAKILRSGRVLRRNCAAGPVVGAHRRCHGFLGT